MKNTSLLIHPEASSCGQIERADQIVESTRDKSKEMKCVAMEG